jgi:FlaA1/EpsC-like NDP-sugar epimerase
VGRRCIVYGAGDGGTLALKELQNRDMPVRILGFIDDDPLKARARVQGYPVLGGYSVLVSLIEADAAELVVVSTRLAEADRFAQLEELCAERRVGLLQLSVDLRELVAAS